VRGSYDGCACKMILHGSHRESHKNADPLIFTCCGCLRDCSVEGMGVTYKPAKKRCSGVRIMANILDIMLTS